MYGKTILSPLYEDDTTNRYFHLYFNPSKQAAERELLEQRLDSLKLNLDKHKGTDAAFGKAYHDYFDIRYDKDGNLASYKEKKDVIQEKLELCGYFCIITSEKMTAAEALIHYKGRDISEKILALISPSLVPRACVYKVALHLMPRSLQSLQHSLSGTESIIC